VVPREAVLVLPARRSRLLHNSAAQCQAVRADAADNAEALGVDAAGEARRAAAEGVEAGSVDAGGKAHRATAAEGVEAGRVDAGGKAHCATSAEGVEALGVDAAGKGNCAAAEGVEAIGAITASNAPEFGAFYRLDNSGASDAGGAPAEHLAAL